MTATPTQRTPDEWVGYVADLFGTPEPDDTTPPADTGRGAGPAPADDGLRGQKRMAYRWARMFGGRYIYTAGRGWLQWTGSHWQVCDDAGPWRGVQAVCREALHDMADMPSGTDRDDLYRDVRACDSDRGTQGVLAHASRETGIRVDDSDLNRGRDIFTFRNGTLDLLTGEFRQSNPADLMTLVAGCDYDPSAECPLYDSLMEQYQPDREVRDYLHRLGGAAMEGRQNLQHLITWYGATGGNGKGTVMRAWQQVFGTYSHVVPVEALIARKSRDDAYRDQKAQLQGTRLVWATEPSDGARFDSGTVKSLTGNDIVSARAMYKASIKFDSTWLIIMPTNTRVGVSSDGGMERRLKEIGWDFRIDRSKMDASIDERLKAELPGIANRLILGWFSYSLDGIRHPESVEQATREYLSEVDPLVQFLDLHTVRDGSARTPASALYERYYQWCESQHDRSPWSGRVFGEKLRRKLETEGLVRKRDSDGLKWIGIRLV